MYMGVILVNALMWLLVGSAPHVYGGDPRLLLPGVWIYRCSPCIWG